MLVTEEEAGRKHCPRKNLFCAGAHCMAWRWWDSLKDDGSKCDHRPTVIMPRVPEPDTGRELSERRGYCGLAGGYSR
jgi:hypothetical protein